MRVRDLFSGSLTETVVRVMAIISQTYDGRSYYAGQEFDMRDGDVRKALADGYVRLVSETEHGQAIL